MLKLGLLNADLDVRGVGAVEEVKLFRLTESEKRDFEKRLPDFSALVADLNLINIDSFKFLHGFSEQLAKRVHEGSLLLCFTSRPNLHSPDGIQNKYSWLPLFDSSKEIREDLVDKIKPGDNANGVTSALDGLIGGFYATCSFPDGFGSEPYNTLLQDDDGLPVGMAKSIGKGWVLLIPQAEEKSKVLESALEWWNAALNNPDAGPGAGEDEPLAASGEADNYVDTQAAEMSELESEPVDLGDLSAAPTADEPAPSLDELELETGSEGSLEPAGNDEFETEPASPSASLETDADSAAEDDDVKVADLGDLEASVPATDDFGDDDSTEDEAAEDMNDLLAAPPPGEEDEFAGMSEEPVDLDIDSTQAQASGPGLDSGTKQPPEDTAEDTAESPDARREVLEGAQDELSALLESAADNADDDDLDEDKAEIAREEAAAARASIEDIGLDSPIAPAWLDEFKADIPGISDIVEEAEKLEADARRLLDRAGELRGRIDALSRWDRLLYLNHAQMAEELGEFFHVVLGADMSLEDELDDDRPTLKMLSAEGDFLVHVVADKEPIGEEVGRDLMRHLADADVDTKGMLVLNGSLGRTPPRSPEEHAQKKLVKLAAKRGLVIVTVNQLYRLGLQAQQDENWDPEPLLEQLAEQSGLFEMEGDKD